MVEVKIGVKVVFRVVKVVKVVFKKVVFNDVEVIGVVNVVNVKGFKYILCILKLCGCCKI